MQIPAAGATLAAALVLAAPASAAPQPFPTDAGNTVRDAGQRTGKRIAMRLPSCAARPSDCNDIGILNRLDGFDVDPRIVVRFDRPIDVRQVSPRTLYVRPADRGPRVGVNRLVYDSRTRTLTARTREQLREATRYRLVVDLPRQRAQTTFTTTSASAQTRAMATRARRDAGRLRITHRFAAAAVRALRVRIDGGTAGLVEAPVPDLARAGGGIYAFGELRARQWLRRDRTIEQVATRRTPRPVGTETIAVSLIVPAGAAPRGGWPVAIFGHGFTRSRLDLQLAADANARRGLATLALTIPGHGGGPDGRLLVDLADGTTADLAFRGRAVDLDGDGIVGGIEGVLTALPPSPVASISSRDVLRQAALDVASLAAAVRRGVDVDGDGNADLSRERIGYYGQSFGGMYGPVAAALDPGLRPAAFNVGGAPVTDVARLGTTFRPLVGALLGGRVPNLLNGGRAGFTEAEPLYGARPVVDPPAGAMAIDDALAVTRWIARSGDPSAYAPALAGDREVMLQVAYGDQTVPNPASAALARAGALASRTVLFRNDRTVTAALNPHGMLVDPRFGRDRALAQDQVLDFLRRPRLGDPDGARTAWELAPPLRRLDRLNFRPLG